MRIRILHNYTWHSRSWLTAEAATTVMRTEPTTAASLGYLHGKDHFYTTHSAI
jgi:hypothetical protein